MWSTLSRPVARALWSGSVVVGLAATTSAQEEPKQEVRSDRGVSVVNEVEGQTTILDLVPEGKIVKKGDVVGTLDASLVREALTDQEIAGRRAEAEHQNATKTHELAEINLKLYQEGTLPNEIEEAKADVLMAKLELALAGDKYTAAKRALSAGKGQQAIAKPDAPVQPQHEDGLDEPSLRVRETEIAKLRAERASIKAEKHLETLTRFAGPRRIRELQADIAKADADLLVKESMLRLAKAKEERLRRQIEKCDLRAPVAGRVVYVKPTGPPPFRAPVIETGANVRHRQMLLRIVPVQDGPP